MYFQINHTVYRYHFASKTVDEIYYDEELHNFHPLSSYVIIWVKKNPEYQKEYEKTKDEELAGSIVQPYIYFTYNAKTKELTNGSTNREEYVKLRGLI